MFRFADFVLDVKDHTLTRSGLPVHLRPKSFDTLVYLVRHHGRLVTRDELLEAIWAGVVVTDGTLTHCIEEIRVALDDDPRNVRFLQTVPHLGYRFVAEVGERGGDACDIEIVEEDISTVSVRVCGSGSDAVPGGGQPELHAAGKWWRRALLPAALVVITGCVLGVLWFARSQHTPGRAITSLAVLPFQDLGRVQDEDYFAEGLTDAMIGELARIRALRVISRTSVMQYKNSTKPLTSIAAELQVDGIIEGSVFRSGERVRISAALISSEGERHLWSETYEMDQRDIVGRLRTIACTLAREISIELPQEEQEGSLAGRSVAPAVYEQYLKGRYHWNKRSAEGFWKGIECFERALNEEPSYAPAYVGLADCYNLLGDYDYLPPRAAFPKARAAALQALSIDGKSAEAHASLAFAAMRFDWNWAEVEREYRLAAEMSPSSSCVHHWNGLYLAMRGRFDEAGPELDRAHALDPLALIITANRAWVRYFAREYEQALGLCREALDLDPGFISAHVKLGWVYEQMHRYPEARAQFQRAIDSDPGNPVFRLFLAHTCAVQGERQEALALIREAASAARGNYLPAYHVAAAYAGLGERRSSMEWLRTAYRERSGWLPWLKVDPKFDVLRGEPDFEALLDSLQLH